MVNGKVKPKTLEEFQDWLNARFAKLESRILGVETEQKKLQVGSGELKDFSQVEKRLAKLEQVALLRTDVSKDQEGRLHLKQS